MDTDKKTLIKFFSCQVSWEVQPRCNIAADVEVDVILFRNQQKKESEKANNERIYDLGSGARKSSRAPKFSRFVGIT